LVTPPIFPPPLECKKLNPEFDERLILVTDILPETQAYSKLHTPAMYDPLPI
jgi:hypothetical protein